MSLVLVTPETFLSFLYLTSESLHVCSYTGGQHSEVSLTLFLLRSNAGDRQEKPNSLLVIFLDDSLNSVVN